MKIQRAGKRVTGVASVVCMHSSNLLAERNEASGRLVTFYRPHAQDKLQQTPSLPTLAAIPFLPSLLLSFFDLWVTMINSSHNRAATVRPSYSITVTLS